MFAIKMKVDNFAASRCSMHCDVIEDYDGASSSFCVMAVSALAVLRWIAIKFGSRSFP